MLVGSIVGRESFKYKGLEKVAYVACLGNSMEASGDGAEWTKGRLVEDEARGDMRQVIKGLVGYL